MTSLEFKAAMGSNPSNEKANHLCAQRINAVWAEQGIYIAARVEVRLTTAIKGYQYEIPVVVSNTKNGLPL